MPNTSGNDTKLQIGLETSYGTYATPTLPLEVTSFSPNENFGIIESSALVGKAMSHTISTGMKKVEGSFTVEVNPDNLGLLLYLATGAEADPVEEDTDLYSHTFTPVTGGTSLPSYSIVADKKVDVFTYLGCKINKISFSVAPDNYVSATIDIIGQRAALTGAIQSLSYSSLTPYRFKDLAISFGTAGSEAGTSIIDCKGISPSYMNNLEADRNRADGNDYPAEVDYQKREFTMDLELDYTSAVDAYRASNFKTGTALSVQALFTHETDVPTTGEKYSFTIDVPYAYITSAPVDVSGPERLSVTFGIKATDGTNGNVAFKIQDARSTKWSA